MAGKKKDKVKVAKNKSVSKSKAKSMRKKPGGSNVGKYKNVKEKNFAGPSGGSPEGSYPIDTKAHAKSALKLAHNAPNPKGIKKAVFEKYPDLRKSHK